MKKLPFAVWSIITVAILFVGVLMWILFSEILFPVFNTNFSYRANILSYDNFFDEQKNDFSGEILSKTRYSYKVEKKEYNVLTIANIFDVRKPSGDTIFVVKRLYGIDQNTGKHLKGFGDKDRSGYLFAPQNPGKEFTYWHINYDMPALMKFRGEEIIDGLLVYRYECDYKADQTENLKFLPGVPLARGVELDINLKLWIEPTTGYLIKYEDHTIGWFYDMKTKKRIHPWNRFHNQFEETSISDQVQIASVAKDLVLWHKHYFPLIILFLILIVITVGYKSEQKSVWKSYFATGLIFITGLTFSIFLYQFLKKNDDIRLETIFNRDCESIRFSAQRELERSIEVLNSIKVNFVTHKGITREKFNVVVKQSLKNSENIKVIAWIPYVTLKNRAAFENKAQAEGLRDFKISELQNDQLVTCGKREIYYPIYYVEPFENSKTALGFDFASNLERKTALEKAASTGEVTATEPIVLVQQLKEKNNKSFLVIIPLFEYELGLSDKHIVNSYLSAGININELLQEAILRVNLSNNVSITVRDYGTKNGKILFTNTPKNIEFEFEKKTSFQVADRLWNIEFKSTPVLSNFQSSWFTTAIPLLIVLITFILGIFVFIILNDKSKKLLLTNMQLTNEIAERTKAEKKLNENLYILASQNTQLSDFCYIISHNLRGPLVNIAMLVDYIENTNDIAEQKEMFGKIKPVVNTINETFNELVESLQVKFDLEIELDTINLSEYIEKMFVTLGYEISSSRAEIEVNIKDAPIIKFPGKYMDSLLFNLISNAIKYKSPERKLIIKIKSEKVNNHILLSVNDNGLGIDINMHKNNLFKIRKVFHKHPDARGFGLFMTKTQVETMGGKIWVESTPNVGSTFFVEFLN